MSLPLLPPSAPFPHPPYQLNHLLLSISLMAPPQELYPLCVRSGLRPPFLFLLGDRAAGHTSAWVTASEKRFWVRLISRQLQLAVVRERLPVLWGQACGVDELVRCFSIVLP